MSRFFPYIQLAVLSLALAGCRQTDEAPFLAVETESIVFGPERVGQAVSFKSNVNATVASSQPWCTAKIVSGNSSSLIEIRVGDNPVVGQERNAEVTVSAATKSVAVRVKQRGTRVTLSVNAADTEQLFPGNAVSRQITVTANVAFTANSSHPWCRTEILPNGTDYHLNISVDLNGVMKERTAKIVLLAQDAEPVEIIVRQEGVIADRPGMTIKGWVSCDNEPVADVVVSDGCEVTVTDSNGIYYLPSQKQTGFVFISTPGDYETDSRDGIPQFFHRLQTSVSTVERKDFALTRVNNDKHVVLAIADWHLANRTADLAQFNTCLVDINSVIDSYRAAGIKVYGLTLGDMSWDTYWYSNHFALPEYLAQMKRVNTVFFNTMGNHDNNRYITDDQIAEQPYKEIIGPTWYSFNLGKVHYVVLDNIQYINTGGAQGVIGNGNYNDMITASQIDWLKKDLAEIQDKNAPLIVAMHIHLYNQPNVNNAATVHLDNGQELIHCFAGFSDVHVLTGHLHLNYRVNTSTTLMEHNTAALCATWWWTGNTGHAGNHICKDGSVGGYAVWEMDGKNTEWYYKSIGYPRSYQFRTYDLNTIRITATQYAPSANATYATKVPTYAGSYANDNTSNEVLINVWGYDSDWQIEVKEGATTLPVTRISAKDPLHIISYECQRLNKNAEPTADFVSNNTTHFFKVTASNATSTLNIKVTDRFGNVYTEAMARPKQLTINSE
ncbi:MAG: calcineurin-like phosphoesterase C-terminal domain-containing protein [Bacteroidales bacterium]|nr:calcineurin-like phosphoesterase C-terminal domain-containing protein [Bacteroidales bacterium]